MMLNTDTKILIIDDIPHIRKNLHDILIQLGFKNLIQAENGLEGYQTLEKDSEIELVIVDLHMPVMDGKEFIKKVRANNKMLNIRIIVQTTSDQKDDILDVIQDGITNYILKPVDANLLRDELVKIFSEI